MKISLKNSGVLNGGAAIPPTAEHMEFGEVAINYSATDPAIFIKDSSGVIRRVSGKGNISFDNYQAVIPISSVGPGTAANGNLYWDQDDERLYIYNGTAWKDASKLPFNAAVIPDLTNAANQSGTFDDRYLRFTGGTLTGALTTSSGVFVNSSYINLNNSNIAYQGASNGQGGFFKTTIDAINATANNTINFPNRSGTVITTGDSGSITASMISSGSITDAQISSTAAISPSKLATGTLPSGVQVNSANIVDGSIVNADISGSAAIDLTKLGTGNLPSGIQVTTNNFTGGIPASDITSGTLGSDVKVSSASYQAGSISNAAISNTAEIAVSKLVDGSARQLLQTNAFGNDVEWASDIDIPGTLDVTGNAVFDGRVTISDVFTVNSSEITLNAPIVNITDKNITLNSVASPSDANADGGGLSVAGSTTKTFTYDVSNSSFTSSEHLNLVNGKGYEINGASVLTHTTLGAGVVNSSLESVGTISSGTWQGSVIDDTYISTIDTAGKVANSATTATPANTPNSIVSRNASGDFTARIINAALSGNASTATALETARTIALSGDLSGSVSFDGTSNVTINAAIASSVTDTNLSWTPSTMTIGSSTGDDVNLTLFTSTAPGLTPYSGGGTTNFLRADGTWAEPQADSTNLSWTSSTSTINSSTGTGVAIPAFDSYNKGLVPSSGGGTTKFLRADGSWVTVGTTASQGADLAYVAGTRTVTNTNGDGFTLPEATTSDAGLLSSTDKTKLDGVAAGAEVNTVTSVNGQTGAVTINGTTDLSYTASSRLLESSTGNDVTLPEATTSDAGLLSSSDKTKLDSISSNAAVTSVNAATGVVVLDADDIDDTSTNHKFVTASDVTALSTLSSDLAGKADLSNGKLDTSQLPDLAISEFKGSVANESAMLAVTGEKGDWVIRTDNSKVYVITGNDPSNSSDWTALSYPVAPDTDLSYASSTRVLSSSTGTDATLPEVVAAGDSGLMTGSDKTKLDGIESGATADQTGAEIKTAYEGEADTNAFTDAEKTKLSGIETGAEVNTVTSVNGQTGAVTINGTTDLSYTASTRELASSTGNNATLPEVVASGNSGLITGSDKAKLDGIEAGATADQTAAEILTAIKTVDGAGSGLDADLLDGQHGSHYLDYNNFTNTPTIPTNNNQLTNGAGYITSADGGNAGTLDGIDSSSFLRSDAADTFTQKLTGGLSGGAMAFDLATNDNYASMRVIQNKNSSGDGMYLGFQNGNNGVTRIFGGGAGTGGIEVRGSGTTDVKINGNTAWHAGNDGSGSGLDADTLDGIQASSFLRSDANDIATGTVTFNGRVNIRGHIDLSDGENLDFGSSDDVRFNYNGSDNWLYCNFITGNGIIFQDNGSNKIIFEDSGVIRPSLNGAHEIGTSTYSFNNGYFNNFTVNSTLNVRGAIDLGDNDILRFGWGDDCELFTDGSHMYMDLNSGIGNFYIRDGTTTRFTFDDAGHFTASGNVTAYSDITLKENIEVIPNALDKVLSIRGITYNRKDLEDNPRHAGVIAQEVEKVLPEVVSTDEEGIKSVAYGNLVGLLIEAVKELKAEVETLKVERN